MARSAYREAVGYFEQALSALPHLPEQRDTREQAIDLRLALRTALSPSGDFGRILAYSARGRGPRCGPRRPASAGTGLCSFCHAISSFMGAYDQAIAAAQRALALATAGGDVVLHALANQLPRPPTRPRATIVGRSTASGRPWRPSTGRGAASASVRSSCPP